MTTKKKTEQLQYVLAKKLCERFSSGDDKEANQKVINSEVAKLITKKNGKPMTRVDFQNLERRVERELENLKNSFVKVPAKKDVIDSAEDVILPEERARAVSKEKKPRSIPMDNYLVIDEANTFEYQRELKLREKRRRKKQIDMKRALDEQVDSLKNRNHIDNEIEEKYANHVKKIHQEWTEEQKRRKIKIREQNAILRKERDEQFAYIRERRQRSNARRRAEEEKLIENAKEELRKEEERRISQIKYQKQYMGKVQRENEEQKVIKERKRKQEQDNDKRLQDEYNQRIEDQERMRKETFEKMKEKSTNNQKMYLKATAEKDRQEKEDEERALMYQMKKIKDDEKKERVALNNIELEKKRMNRILAGQVEEQKLKYGKDSEAEEKFADAYKKEAIQAIEEEKQRAKARRRRAYENKRELQKQIQAKLNCIDDTDSSSMTEYEKQINLPTLVKLAENEDIVNAITNRLERTLVAQTVKNHIKKGMRNSKREDEEYYIL